MNQSQRRLHFRIWLILGPLLLTGMVIAWLNRPSPAPQNIGASP